MLNVLSGINTNGLPFIYSFLSLRGNPDAVKQRIEIVARNGVDGVGLFRTGIRGEPFTIESAVDTVNKEAARVLYRSYRTTIGAQPARLIWSDLDISDGDAVLFAVLDVLPIRVQSLAAASGGLNPPSRGWLEARWVLVPIAG